MLLLLTLRKVTLVLGELRMVLRLLLALGEAALVCVIFFHCTNYTIKTRIKNTNYTNFYEL